ncbi:hypothetical protein A8950_0790 [Dongia mobilis]|uniref:Lipoprotein n=1 Tax=Dongia mobilis TaxID=578943 RepID=A0A4R6WRL0_9PROT|nr:hypothetical protein [Dongia mobilis]TDQ84242.1 hypothetical protein A8950_0790 [Dongia mobilis]
MRSLRSVLSLLFALGLAACFVQHAEPIGVAEPARAGQWSGLWVAQPVEPGGEPGFFRVEDVEPSSGRFSVAEADPDGNPIEDAIPLLLRRVDDTLFIEVQEKDGDPWRLFVVASMQADRLELAWKPVGERFAVAFTDGALAGRLVVGSEVVPDELVLTDFTPQRQGQFARNWAGFFLPERLVLIRPVNE